MLLMRRAWLDRLLCFLPLGTDHCVIAKILTDVLRHQCLKAILQLHTGGYTRMQLQVCLRPSLRPCLGRIPR